MYPGVVICGSSGTFEHITAEHGLAHNNVTCILQDSTGFLWFGTLDGLHQFDGYDFKILKNDPRDPKSLSDNNVLCICENDDSTLWVGTANGLNFFHFKNNQNTRFLGVNTDHKTLSNNRIQCLATDMEENLWVGTAWGLNRFNRGKRNFDRFIIEGKGSHIDQKNRLNTIYEDSSGKLWMGSQLGLGLIDKTSGKITFYNHDLQQPGSANRNYINSILEDEPGVLLVGTRDGLYRFFTGSGSFEKTVVLPFQFQGPATGASYIIFTLGKDRDNILWMGTNRGIVRFDKKNRSISLFDHDPQDPRSVSDNDIISIFQDSWGILWFGTYNAGINKYDKAQENFTRYSHEADQPSSLSNNNVLSLFEDSSGRIWTGTDNGLNLLDRESSTFERFIYDPADPHSLQGDFVKSICEDSSGNLWIGTFWGKGSCLNRFDVVNKRFSAYRHRPGDPHSLSNNNVGVVYVDRSGTLWVGTEGGGLNRFSPKTGTFTVFRLDGEDPQSIISDWISTIFEDSSGTLWVGTEGGLSKMNRETGIFTNYTVRSGEPKTGSISNNRIRVIFEDSRGNLWIGTENGLNRYNKSSDSFIFFTGTDGLPSSMIMGIVEDKYGFLWITTTRGIARFDQEQKEFWNLDLADGLKGMQFNRGACLTNRNGEIMLGGRHGITQFLPGHFKVNWEKPPVVITDFKIFNQPQPLIAGLAPSLNKRGPRQYNKICLSYKQNFFSFDFAALDFTRPERNRYAYKMEGLDEDWIPLGTRRFVSFTHLPAGDYTFRVKGTNHDHFWNEEGAAIGVCITPPYWKTTWFMGLVILLALGSAWGFYRYRIGRIQKLKKRLELLVEKRTQQLQDANKELELLAREDGLTKLLNKRAFKEIMERDCRRAQREGHPISLIMLDVDFFKIYNDTYGHQAGDDCLARIADVMRLSVNRPGDVVARYGGEEFVVLLYNTKLTGAIHVAKAIRHHMAEARIPFEKSTVSEFVTISSGVATFVPTDEYEMPIIILAADTALYQAKAAGRDTIFIFNTDSPLDEKPN